MIRRLLFIVFFICGGFLFLIPYWVVMGTKASRQRKALLKQQRQTNRLLERQLTKPQQAQPQPPANYGARSADGRWWWDGQQWRPIG